jgi:hypothetical protein
MGLEQREGGNFITILGGKFCQRVPAGTEGAVERVNKLGKVVHERYYDSFTGKLVNIRTQDTPYGKQWVFDFKDKEEVYHLQLSYSNSFATNILKILPNVDLTKEMKVSPQTKEIDGKQRSSLFINQEGIALKHAYTKDVPNGLPDMEKVIVKGQEVWDDTKRLAFLHNMVMTQIMPKLEGGTGELKADAEADAEFNAVGTEPKAVVAGEIPADDIPF